MNSEEIENVKEKLNNMIENCNELKFDEEIVNLSQYLDKLIIQNIKRNKEKK